MVAGTMGRDCRSKVAVCRDCGIHSGELTIQGANKRGSWQHCVYCAPADSLPKGIHPASELAKAADQLLRAHPAVQRCCERIITEAKVLNGKFGAFDFSLVLRGPADAAGNGQRRRLEVEVDGVQHFSHSMHSTTSTKQKQVDKRKDKAAWEAGRCLLRLHYLDRRFWGSKIDEAVRRATLPGRIKLLLYTSSYGKKDRAGPAQVSRAARGQHHSHGTRGHQGCPSPW
jgi:hypothetical protein